MVFYLFIYKVLIDEFVLSFVSPSDEDDVFEFPAVHSAGPALDTQSITLMTGSAQRISVRLQRATTSQATQTEPLWPELSWGATESGSHTFPKMKYRTHRKMSKNKGFACWENQNGGRQQAVSSRCSVDYQQNKRSFNEEPPQNRLTNVRNHCWLKLRRDIWTSWHVFSPHTEAVSKEHKLKLIRVRCILSVTTWLSREKPRWK